MFFMQKSFITQNYYISYRMNFCTAATYVVVSHSEIRSFITIIGLKSEVFILSVLKYFLLSRLMKAQ